MDKRVAVVTGGNRGMGLETCRQLAREGLKFVLASRDQAKGEEAAAELRKENEGAEVVAHQLDVTDGASVSRFAGFVGETFGRLDVLVNNAGIIADSNDPSDAAAASIFVTQLETMRESMETNAFGPMRLCQALVPLMRENGYGRVVNVSTGMGQISDMNGGWLGYRVSKASLNAITRILADELKDTNILVNALCPGFVRTDLGGPNAPRSIEEGVVTTIWLATLPDDGPTGGFFRDRKPIAW